MKGDLFSEDSHIEGVNNRFLVLRRKNQDFLSKMQRVYVEKYASYIGGDHIFRKIMKKGDRKVKNVTGRP